MIAAALAAVLAVAAPASAGVSDDDDVPTMRVYDSWRVSCPATTEAGKSCALSQDVVLTSTMARLYELTITRSGSVDTLAVMLPYNVLLEPGAGIDFGDGGKPVLIDFEVCDHGSCIARIPFTGSFAADFAKAKAPRVLFAGLDGKPVGAPFSLNGFGRALNAYRRFERQRGAASP